MIVFINLKFCIL